MTRQNNILDKIIKSVLSEATVEIPVRIYEKSVDETVQQQMSKTGAIFAFRVGTNIREKKLKGVSVTEKIALQAIASRISTTTFPQIKKYLTGNYWFLQSNNLDRMGRDYEYIYFVYPRGTIEGIANPIFPVNRNEFYPNITYKIGTTPVTNYTDFLTLFDKFPDLEFMNKYATDDEFMYDSVQQKIDGIANLLSDPYVTSNISVIPPGFINKIRKIRDAVKIKQLNNFESWKKKILTNPSELQKHLRKFFPKLSDKTIQTIQQKIASGGIDEEELEYLYTGRIWVGRLQSFDFMDPEYRYSATSPEQTEIPSEDPNVPPTIEVTLQEFEWVTPRKTVLNYKFQGKITFDRFIKNDVIRRYRGFLTDESGKKVIIGTWTAGYESKEDPENPDRRIYFSWTEYVTIETATVNDLEMSIGEFFTGTISNNIPVAGTFIWSSDNKEAVTFEKSDPIPFADKKYEGSFKKNIKKPGRWFFGTGLFYDNKTGKLLFTVNDNSWYPYEANGTVNGKSSSYQIRELQLNIIEMWNFNKDLVDKAPTKLKKIINDFLQNGVTGIWDLPTADMVNALNIAFKNKTNGNRQIDAADHQRIIKYKSEKPPVDK